MYGNGPPGPDRQRSQHREDLLREQPVDRLQLLVASSPGRSTTRIAVLGERGAHLLLPRARVPARRAPRRARSTRSSVSRADSPSGPRASMPASTWSCRPGHPHHEELVQVGGVDREELDALEQRDALVLGQLEHALVELEPRDLAVHEQLRRVERRGLALVRLPPPSCPYIGDAPCSGCCAMETLPTDRRTPSGRSPRRARSSRARQDAPSSALGVRARARASRARRCARPTPRGSRARSSGVEPQHEPKLAGGPFDAGGARRGPRRRRAAGGARSRLLDGGARAHRRAGAHEEGRPRRRREGRAQGAPPAGRARARSPALES